MRIEILAVDPADVVTGDVRHDRAPGRPPTGRRPATQQTRAASGATSCASCSKSSAVTARPRERSSSGPRALASSRVSASAPPTAGARFSTRETYGTTS